MPKLALRLAIILATLAPASLVDARAENTYRYPFEQLWGTAVRMLRVDYGFTIRDRDRDVGYVLFDYQDSGRSVPGSVEFIRVQQEGRAEIRVSFQVPAMPSYISRMLIDRLSRKLRADFGEQPRPPRRPVPDERPDPDDDEDEDEASSRSNGPT